MNERDVKRLLEAVAAGRLSAQKAVERLKHLPFEDLGFAKIDHHRALRQGYAEVIFGRGKTPEQVARIVRGMLRPKGATHNILVTRADRKIYAAVKRASPVAKFYPLSGPILTRRSREMTGKGTILIVSAGTSDIPVAEEAAVTAEAMGNRVERIYDVGVAGLHRVLDHHHVLSEANVIIAVAGMEGALPSVIGGLVDRPVLAVPTSVGYGASFGGIAALFAILNSGAPGVSVVNIDKGYGAAVQANQINKLVSKVR